jgi:hypothetical protein
MTDRSPSPAGRIDLRGLDSDSSREDRVVAATLARLARDPGREPMDELSTTARRYLWPAVAAAAVLVVTAAGTVIVTARPAGDDDAGQPVAMLSGWAESQHVPTNGELLLAFQGYGGER